MPTVYTCRNPDCDQTNIAKAVPVEYGAGLSTFIPGSDYGDDVKCGVCGVTTERVVTTT